MALIYHILLKHFILLVTNINNKYRSSKVGCESFMLIAHTDPLGFLSTFRALNLEKGKAAPRVSLYSQGRNQQHVSRKVCLCGKNFPFTCKWKVGSAALQCSADDNYWAFLRAHICMAGGTGREREPQQCGVTHFPKYEVEHSLIRHFLLCHSILRTQQ